MKKRMLFGLLALSVVFAVLVSACYRPDFDPFLSGVRLDETDGVILIFSPPELGTHDFRAILSPNGVNWAEKEVKAEWRTTCQGEIISFIGPHRTEFTNYGVSTARVVASSEGISFVIVSVEDPFSGITFYDLHMVRVIVEGRE
ncbi:MAG: hypothetical protein FWB78_11805 [Treponema sp.]|nr:hypothetical protein [Treponema sp.]